jgi:predicted ATPase/DNA-binding SARP family transcriptional activator
MADRALFLLGSPHIDSDGVPLRLSRRKAMALLAYLAVGGPDRFHSRDALATLLWPEHDQSRARHGLRSALSSLKSVLGEGHLEIDREAVCLATSGGHSGGRGRGLWVDVAAFREQLQTCRAHAHPVGEMCPACAAALEEAVTLYDDDFMSGFTLPDSPAFDEWQFFERQDLRDKLAGALQRLALGYGERGEHERALVYARRWAVLDPLHEPTHRLLMRLYAGAGQRAAALRQYTECERVLREELSALPEEETRRLYRLLRERRSPSQPREEDASGREDVQARVRHNLPAQVTPFVGRGMQLAEVCALLTRDEVRLLTLTGAGGTGKTRLAVQVAAGLQGTFADGVCFVGLAPVRDPALILPTIAAVLGVRESGASSLLESLQFFMRDRELLLVVDNLEHLIEGSPALIDLLAAADRLKVLATSRAPLHLYGEHEYVVPPMEVPHPQSLSSLDRLTETDSVQLFLQCAARVQPGFALTQENAPAVADICTRLDGLPLAVELAAARLRLLPPDAILPHLDDRLGFLTGGPRDLPARQRTLRATIEWSHDLLGPREQALLASLAVFAGGFTLEAVQAIAATLGECRSPAAEHPATMLLDDLESLVDQHLVQASSHAGQPRFTLLETVREYALERLDEGQAGEGQAVRRRHACYYLSLAETAAEELFGPGAAAALERLEREHDNVRAALAWSLDAGMAETALRLSGAMGRFWESRGYNSQGREWLRAALDLAMTEGAGLDRWRAKALMHAGWLAWYQSERRMAHALLLESEALWRAVGDAEGLVWVLGCLGILARAHDPIYVRAIYEERITLARQVDAKSALAFALGAQGGLDLQEGDSVRARMFAEEALVVAQQSGMPGAQAYATSILARIALAEGDRATARAWHRESLAQGRAGGHIPTVANRLTELGEIVYLEGDYAQARECSEQSLEIRRGFGNKRGVIDNLVQLAWVALRQACRKEARAHLAQALALSRELPSTVDRGQFTGLVVGAGLAEGREQPEQAARALGAAHTLKEAGVRPLTQLCTFELERLSAAVRRQLDGAAFDAAWAEGQAMALEDRERALAYVLDHAI